MPWAGSFSPGGESTSPGTEALGREAACRAGRLGSGQNSRWPPRHLWGPGAQLGMDVQPAPGARRPEEADACVMSRVSVRMEPPRLGELWAEASTPGPPRTFQDGHQGWLRATALNRIHLEEEFMGT